MVKAWIHLLRVRFTANAFTSVARDKVQIGPYRLEAVLPGFRTYARTGIALDVNSSPRL